jgi:hypothetical protein
MAAQGPVPRPHSPTLGAALTGHALSGANVKFCPKQREAVHLRDRARMLSTPAKCLAPRDAEEYLVEPAEQGFRAGILRPGQHAPQS